MTEPLLLALCAVLAVLVIGLAVALRRIGNRTAREIAALERRFEALEGSRDADGASRLVSRRALRALLNQRRASEARPPQPARAST